MRAIMDALPSRIDHLVVVPWLGISGGSEKVSERLLRLLRDHYHGGGLCVFAPDGIFNLAPDRRSPYGVPIVAVNDIDSTLDQAARTEIVDRVLIEHRPRTVHSINSTSAWLAFRHRAAWYARDSQLFGNVYSDIRIMEGIPVGAFWQFLPDTMDHLTGVIADNRTVVRRAEQHFALLPEQVARHYVVPTPIVGLEGQDPASDLRPFHDSGMKRSLWMSRIAYEKRLDVLQAVAKRCPDRSFSIYGATLAGALPIDLSWIDQAPNVHLRGNFGQLTDLPIENFDSYIFTTSAEGMPIAVLEAAMLGLPIIAPDVGGIGEFVDRSTGWLVSSADAVDEYVAALDEIRRYPDKAARRVAAAQCRLLQRHSWRNFRRTVAAIPGYLDPRAG